MRHEAGVAYVKEPIPSVEEMMDREKLAAVLAKQEHLHGGKRVRSYHAVTRGWILNEVVRRVDPAGRTLGQIYREDFNTLPGIEFHLGLTPELEARRAKWEGYPILDMLLLTCVPAMAGQRGENNFPMEALKADAPLRHLMKMMSAMGRDFENSAVFSAFEAPSSNGFTSASALARIGAIMAAGGSLGDDSLLARDTLALALGDEVTSFDTCICVESTMTRGGFGVFTLEETGLPTKFYGWPGLGGSILVFNLDYNFSFSYVMNAQHISILVGRRARRLLVAAFQAHISCC